MGRSKSFNEFIGQSINNDLPLIRFAAGIAIVYNDMIMLVHPSGSPADSSNYGIPKGKIETGEDPLDAALREVKEEVGIEVNPLDLDSEAFTSPKYDQDGQLKSHLIYFILKIDNLSDIGLDSLEVPQDQLQLEEVDWAGFIKISEAYSKINRYQAIILDRFNK